MKKRAFLSHGSINITVDNDVIIMDIGGPCNTEFFERMVEKLVLIRPQVNMNNYTGLVILRNEALATPEAMAYFTGYLKTIQARAVAINLQYCEMPSMTQELCKKAYTESGVKHRFFFDNENANIWLRECMAVAE